MDIIKCYKRLWRSSAIEKKRLVIINMGWTVKDKTCNFKLNGACDHIMGMLCHQLGLTVGSYDMESDILRTLITRDDSPDEAQEKHETPDIFDQDQVKMSQGYIPGWMRVILNQCPKKLTKPSK